MKKKFSHMFHFCLTAFALLNAASVSAAVDHSNIFSHVARCSEAGRGPVGKAGPVGPTGPTGSQGGFGIDGFVGPQGVTGPTGDPGISGAFGVAGEVGITGPTGEAGPQGFSGLFGATGPDGGGGVTGTSGVTGPAGLTGLYRGYASFYTTTSQNNISSGVVVALTTLMTQSGGFSLSGGGVLIPADGFYQIRYTVSCADVASVVLIGTESGVINSSSTGTIRDDGNIFGGTIAFLQSGETVALRNNLTGPFSTLTPPGGGVAVNMTILWLSET